MGGYLCFVVELVWSAQLLFQRVYAETVLVAILTYVLVRYMQQFTIDYRKCLDLASRGCSSPTHWFFGHLKLFPPTEQGWQKRVSELVRLKGIFITWFGPFKSYVSPHRAKTLGAFFHSSAPKDALMYGFVRSWLGDGLLTSSGPKWQRNRKLLTPAFHSTVLKNYVAMKNRCAKVLVSKWMTRHGQCVDVSYDVGKLTLDVMLQSLMSTESNCQVDSNNRYGQCVRDLLEGVLKRIRSPLFMIDWIFWLSPTGRMFQKACDYVHNEDEKIIGERKKALEKIKANRTRRPIKESKYFDLIDILLRSKDENGQGLSIQEIRDEVDTFLFEGHDTTASGISWLIYNLARHSDYQQRCREEVMKIMGNKEEVEWDDLHQLVYLEMCVKESLRLYPPVPHIARNFNQKITFVDEYSPGGKLEVSPSTSAVVFISAVHRSQLNWDDPLTYNPERFSPANASKHHPFAFLAFSAGPRNCIGKAFAMNEIKVTLCHILRNFELSVDADTPDTVLKATVVVKSENGINVRMTKLNSEKHD